MKIVIVDGKKLGTLIIVGILMMITIGAGSMFKDRLKKSTFIQNNVNSLKTYEGLNKNLSYSLPVDWTTEEKVFNGKEILYHNDFKSPDSVIHGFVEVWNRRNDLKSFLEESKIVSEKQNHISEYTINSIKISDYKGYLVTYTLETDSKVKYKAYEYFLDGDKEFIRISFFIPQDKFKESMYTLFQTVVQTLKYNKL